jgi:hypothetical protein
MKVFSKILGCLKISKYIHSSLPSHTYFRTFSRRFKKNNPNEVHQKNMQSKFQESIFYFANFQENFQITCNEYILTIFLKSLEYQTKFVIEINLFFSKR